MTCCLFRWLRIISHAEFLCFLQLPHQPKTTTARSAQREAPLVRRKERRRAVPATRASSVKGWRRTAAFAESAPFPPPDLQPARTAPRGPSRTRKAPRPALPVVPGAPRIARAKRIVSSVYWGEVRVRQGRVRAPSASLVALPHRKDSRVAASARPVPLNQATGRAPALRVPRQPIPPGRV